jgi:hypothetical protein
MINNLILISLEQQSHQSISIFYKSKSIKQSLIYKNLKYKYQLKVGEENYYAEV